MFYSQLQALLLLLGSCALLGRTGAAPQPDALSRLLKTDSGSMSREDLSQMLRLRILTDLMAQGDGEILPPPDNLDVREEVARQLPFSQRERKAGCRNFFWKTFTSC
ncbi:somatostatin-1 [Denticeps clupeoides]|uniref:somatostatin-1 n=1 Tax=Denticeps clupeoides TaxID=299321 RepID=UPI0010A4D5E6|nr:somatostatin-1-like [Denticeps clupeoides]